MRDLTEQLSNDLSKAINKYRTKAEERQRESEEAQLELNEATEAAHRTFELAASLRMDAANKAMASQFKDFIGAAPSLPNVEDGPAVDLITDHGFESGRAVE